MLWTAAREARMIRDEKKLDLLIVQEPYTYGG